MKKQKLLLIVNPVAGRKKALRALDQIVQSLNESNFETTVIMTEKQGDAKNTVIEQVKGYEMVVCCGGDGTLNEVISGLAELDLKIPIGYIPTGTTNELARSLNLPTNIEDGIKAISQGNLHCHDIGKLNEDMYFSYVASFGAFSKVSYITPQWFKNIFGYIAYVFIGLFSLGSIKSHRVQLEVDGNLISGDYMYGSVSNSKTIGGVIKFAESDVSFDDGEFEVLLIKKPKRLKELQNIVMSISRRSYDEKYTRFIKAKKVSFRFDNEIAWTIDGEYAGVFDSVQIENLSCMANILAK